MKGRREPVNESDPRWNLVRAYVDGGISAEAMAELEAVLREDPDFRADFLDYLKVDAALEGSAFPNVALTPLSQRPPAPRLLQPWIGIAALLVVSAIAGAFLIIDPGEKGTVASVGLSSDDAEWTSAPKGEGEELSAGDRIELKAGSVEIAFQSGAFTRIHGPALFEVTSNNSGYLHFGEAFSRADGESSRGFTILTQSCDFVDQGTEFLTTARKDGFSQLHVTQGEVDAAVEGHPLQRVRKGSGLGIEPGDVPVLIRIEQGDETPAFRFPTIPPPGDSDYADQRQQNARVEWLPTDVNDRENNLAPDSGPVELLLDGRAQSDKDQPEESLFFRDGANGLILIDLGDEQRVSKILTYSWHRNLDDPDLRRRAVQRYILWGCGEKKPAGVPTAEDNAGWTRIARVNTDAFFGVTEDPDRPPQQACAIFSGNDAIGQFRYLLFEVSPTPMPEGARPRHTFFGEIDVFTQP